MTDDPPVWPGNAHTFIKHAILEKYLGTWYAKLGQTHPRILFVDGFAGPGVYEEGQRGSPLVALDAALNHRADLSRCTISLIFIESDSRRAAILEKNVRSRSVPNNIYVYVENNAFEKAFTDLLSQVEGAGAVLVPSFVMIDPFGWTGFPYGLIERLGRHPQSEVLVSFMYEGINRFVGLPDQTDNMTALFGGDDWKRVLSIDGASDRRDFLVDLYRRQLVAAGFEYTYAFELADSGNRTEYFLIHGSKSIEGTRGHQASDVGCRCHRPVQVLRLGRRTPHRPTSALWRQARFRGPSAADRGVVTGSGLGRRANRPTKVRTGRDAISRWALQTAGPRTDAEGE